MSKVDNMTTGLKANCSFRISYLVRQIFAFTSTLYILFQLHFCYIVSLIVIKTLDLAVKQMQYAVCLLSIQSSSKMVVKWNLRYGIIMLCEPHEDHRCFIVIQCYNNFALFFCLSKYIETKQH